MMSFSFGCGRSGEEVDGKCSCEGTRVPYDQVANGGSRRIGSGCNFLGSVQRGSRTSRMVLWRWRSGGGGDRVLG